MISEEEGLAPRPLNLVTSVVGAVREVLRFFLNDENSIELSNASVFPPKKVMIRQPREGYDWICRQAHSLPAIMTRGVRALRQDPIRHTRSKLFSLLGADLGYCRTSFSSYG
jgi:hypothetical protein